MIYFNTNFSNLLRSFVLIVFLVAPNLNQTIAQEDTFIDYKDFLEIRYLELPNNTKLLIHNIKDVKANIKGAEYVNDQVLFWDYLLVNYTDRLKYSPLEGITDSIELQDTYLSYIRQDTILTPIVSDYVAKVFSKTKSKDLVSIDEILNVAIKFFNIEKISPKGEYLVRICVGIEGIKSTEAERNPFLEAFAFNAIMKNLRNEKYGIYPYVLSAVKEINKLNLGLNKEEMLLRAQGALFIQMLQSEKLTNLLEDEYLKDKDVLPFILSF